MYIKEFCSHVRTIYFSNLYSRSFGVALWEVLEFGKKPYQMMSDEEVLQKVVKLRAVGLNTSTTEDQKALYVDEDTNTIKIIHFLSVSSVEFT